MSTEWGVHLFLIWLPRPFLNSTKSRNIFRGFSPVRCRFGKYRLILLGVGQSFKFLFKRWKLNFFLCFYIIYVHSTGRMLQIRIPLFDVTFILLRGFCLQLLSFPFSRFLCSDLRRRLNGWNLKAFIGSFLIVWIYTFDRPWSILLFKNMVHRSIHSIVSSFINIEMSFIKNRLPVISLDRGQIVIAEAHSSDSNIHFGFVWIFFIWALISTMSWRRGLRIHIQVSRHLNRSHRL